VRCSKQDGGSRLSDPGTGLVFSGPRRGAGHRAADHRDLAELAERAAADAEKLLSIARRPLRRTQVKAEALAAVGGKTPLRVGGEGGCAGR